MSLPNTYFQEFPIEFKEINPEDFPGFKVSEKIIITPDDSGYINDGIQVNIDLLEPETLIVNAAVGQGKTYSIIEIIKRYYEAGEDFMIFVASPFVSLVQQYFDKLVGSGINHSDIYRYDYIGKEKQYDAWNSKIQIVTVNCLLGNPGNDKLINSQAKQDYINYLVQKCEQNGKKVVFIYDEIHDAIHNFKEELVFNLWKWKNVICKNIILSATYNEASKIVIEYLAELTADKIKIIESKRKRYVEKQSDLYLHFNDSRFFRHDNDSICSLVNRLVSEKKNIDILCYSKFLADSIYNNTSEGIGEILYDAQIEIQNCTSDLEENQRMYAEDPENRYDPNKCNIGTNFKTGVSIEKENHAFIIIMPPSGARSHFRNNYGIFSSGINSVIQALARQRKKGEIHIVLPRPDYFEYTSLNHFNDSQKQVFKEYYEACKNNNSVSDLVSYIPLDVQDDLLRTYYTEILRKNIEESIDYLSSKGRHDKVRLEYPEFKLFKLEKGEKLMSSEIKFFGKDLSSYITYCSITNQFINCNLKGITNKTQLKFKKGKIQYKLEDFYTNYMSEDLYNSLFVLVTDKYKYWELRRGLFEFRVTYKKDSSDRYKEIRPFEIKDFESQLLAFFQRKFYPKNRGFAKKFNSDGFFIDAEYSRRDYFIACIVHSLRLNQIRGSFDAETIALIDAYSILNYFREKMVANMKTTQKNNENIFYFLNQPFDGFLEEEERTKLNHMVSVLIGKDVFISKGIFEFKRAFANSDKSKVEKTFYKYLIQDFFDTTDDNIYIEGIQIRIKKVLSTIILPDSENVIDLISPASPNISEEYMKNYALEELM